MTERRIRIFLVAIAGWLVPGATVLAADDFHFRADRLAIDGNVDGTAADGTPDVVEEFDAPLAPGAWAATYGDVSVADGFLHFDGPGDEVADGFGALPGIPIHVSQIALASPLRDGAGSFVATSTWAADPIRAGDDYQMTFVSQGTSSADGALVMEAVTISVSNETPPRVPVRYAVTLGFFRLPARGPAPLVSESVLVDPETIDGPVVLTLSLDDAAKTMTASFSLDGGRTVASPFTPRPVFHASQTGWIELGGGSVAAPPDDTDDGNSPPPGDCDGAVTVTGGAVVVAGRRIAGKLHVTGLAPSTSRDDIEVTVRPRRGTPIIARTSHVQLDAARGRIRFTLHRTAKLRKRDVMPVTVTVRVGASTSCPSAAIALRGR